MKKTLSLSLLVIFSLLMWLYFYSEFKHFKNYKIRFTSNALATPAVTKEALSNPTPTPVAEKQTTSDLMSELANKQSELAAREEKIKEHESGIKELEAIVLKKMDELSKTREEISEMIKSKLEQEKKEKEKLAQEKTNLAKEEEKEREASRQSELEALRKEKEKQEKERLAFQEEKKRQEKKWQSFIEEKKKQAEIEQAEYDQKVKKLVQVVELMKPSASAKLLEGMDMQLAMDIFKTISNKKAAPILDKMTGERAVKLSEYFANREFRLTTDAKKDISSILDKKELSTRETAAELEKALTLKQ